MTDPRLPAKHGETVSEVIDLGGPVARIERLTYVNSEWTYLTMLVPADVDQPAASVKICLNREHLAQLVGKLAWPT